MQSIGERLEEARKRKGVTIREAAEATKIRGDYLNSFENNNFQINVPDIYTRGFLRSYCNFLKVNSEKVITDYNANLLGEAKAAKREHREFFGRMELQQTPLVNEEGKQQVAPIDDAKLRTEEDDGAKVSFLDKIDKESAIKIGIVAVASVLFLLVIVWVFRTLTSGGIDETTANQQNSSGLVPTEQTTPAQTQTQAAASETVYLVAIGDVRVSVFEHATGTYLLNDHAMAAGMRQAIEKKGKIRIEYSAGENLNVEMRGKLMSTGKTGQNYATIP